LRLYTLKPLDLRCDRSDFLSLVPVSVLIMTVCHSSILAGEQQHWKRKAGELSVDEKNELLKQQSDLTREAVAKTEQIKTLQRELKKINKDRKAVEAALGLK
jgi:uncharacterized protein YlxW (UPF0749 family)